MTNYKSAQNINPKQQKPIQSDIEKKASNKKLKQRICYPWIS